MGAMRAGFLSTLSDAVLDSESSDRAILVSSAPLAHVPLSTLDHGGGSELHHILLAQICTQISESFTFKPCGHVPGAGCRTRVVGELRIFCSLTIRKFVVGSGDAGARMDAGL